MLKDNSRLILGDGHALRIAGYARPGRPIVVSEGDTPIEQMLKRDGTLALPHYIHREVGPPTSTTTRPCMRAARRDRAPTAGLHFTDDVFKALAAAGIRIAKVTLHIGPGTFAPVRDVGSRVTRWKPNGSRFRRRRDAIEHTRRVGGRIIAVGTSSTRALESWAITGDAEGSPGSLFIRGFASNWSTR